MGMFTWPTPLKYPESMSKYTEPTAEEYLDMDKNLGFLCCTWALEYIYMDLATWRLEEY